MEKILLTIINTFYAKDDFNELLLNEHFNKFIPIENTECLICIDACSKNYKNNIFEKYSLKGFKIIKNQKHSYAGGCRNIGLKYSHGKYVMFIDSYDDSLYSGKEFNLKNILHNLIEFISTEYDSDIIELSNYYNKFYKAMPWNIFWNTSFLKKHNLFFIEWQGFEDFLFTFVSYKLNAIISIYLYKEQILLTYKNKQFFKKHCYNIHHCCYNHAKSNTTNNYEINNFKKYNEACDWIFNILHYIPKEFIGYVIINNIDNEFGRELLKNNINLKLSKKDVFDNILNNIEHEFKCEKYLQIDF